MDPAKMQAKYFRLGTLSSALGLLVGYRPQMLGELFKKLSDAITKVPEPASPTPTPLVELKKPEGQDSPKREDVPGGERE